MSSEIICKHYLLTHVTQALEYWKMWSFWLVPAESVSTPSHRDERSSDELVQNLKYILNLKIPDSPATAGSPE